MTNFWKVDSVAGDDLKPTSPMNARSGMKAPDHRKVLHLRMIFSADFCYLTEASEVWNMHTCPIPGLRLELTTLLPYSACTGTLRF